jgi:hypothetical protein
VRSSIGLRRTALCGLATIAVLGAGGGSATAVKTATKQITCKLTLYATIKQPAPTAANFGAANCSAPLRNGVQRDASTTTRTSPLTGSFTGPFKMFFDRGSIHGTFTISFVTTVDAALHITGVTYKGTLKVTGGSARNKRVRGTGTITGFSPDAVKTNLTEVLTLTGV